MIVPTAELLRPLVAQARLAPSVHNIQPSRWRIGPDRLHLLGDPRRAIPVADPHGRDGRLSHGCHFEGFALALAQSGLQAVELALEPDGAPLAAGGLVPIAACALVSLSEPPQKGEPVEDRVSWRGAFQAADPETAEALARISADQHDCIVVGDRARVADIAAMGDRAALHFLREDDHRAELLQWLRLSKTHPDYLTDGLNADAMHMSPIEARAAGLVLGRLFRSLDRIGLAAPLVKEAAKTRSAAAIVLFHRPRSEDPFLSGRAFYRAWLAFERHGLVGCPMSVLADWDETRQRLEASFAVPADRRIVSVFRIGRPKGRPSTSRARLPLEQLFV